MKAGPKRRVAASLVTVATAVCGIAFAAPAALAASGHGVPEASAVRAVAAQEGISREQARENLTTQQAAGDVVGQLKRALGADYAGVWFDRATGRFSVAAAPETDRPALRRLLASDGLGDAAEVVEVDSTWADLEAAQRSLTEPLKSLIDGERAFTSIDPVGNRVVVAISEESPAILRARLAASARRSAVEVEIREVPSSRLSLELDACTSQSFCDAPVRGGIRIETSPYPGGGRGWCSSAFAVADSVGSRYLLTAGHCLIGDTIVSTQPWSTKSSSGGTIQLGASANATNGNGSGDVGIVRVPAGVDATAAVHMRGVEDARAIFGTAGPSYVGQTLCGSGATSGFRCGQVRWTNVTWIDGAEITGPFDGVTTPGACSDGGDSGSAWVAGNYGSGIHSGSESGCVIGETSWFTPLALAEAVLNVRTIRTRKVAMSFNGDAAADLIVGSGAGGYYAVATSTGSALGGPGTQQWLQGWDGDPEFGDIGDFDGDGKTDLVVRDARDGTFDVALSDGARLGAPGTGTWFSDWTARPHWLDFGDFNGDGRDDLITGDGDNAQYAVATSTGHSFGGPGTQLWLQGWDGDPEFGEVGDFNGDGKDDLVIRNDGDGTFAVALSDGTSLRAPGSGTWFSSWTGRPDWFRVGDFNGDGRDDLIVGVDALSGYAVALSDGSSFGAPGTQFWLFGWDPSPEWGGIADFNGDGKDDLIVRDHADGTFAVALSNGTELGAPGTGTWLSTWTGTPDWLAFG